MSQVQKLTLTDFITQPDIRMKLDQYIYFPDNPCRDLKIRVPLTNRRYVLVGHAFDILLSLYLEKNYTGFCKESFDYYKYERIAYLNNSWSKAYLKATKECEKYLKSKKSISENIIRAAIVLAKFENCSRCGYPPTDLDIFYEEDTQDLLKMIEVLPQEIIPKKRIYLGSGLCCGGSAVRAADIDLLIDDTIIDVKTVSVIKDRKSYFRQVICYNIMIGNMGLGEWNKNKGKKIELSRVGIYYSRFGFFETYLLSDMVRSKESLDALKKILVTTS